MAKTKCTKLTVDYRGGKLQFGIHPPTGQYRKKYKGHTLYLGAKPDGVLNQWLAKTDQLEIDLKASAALEGDSVTVKQLCDLFLSGKDRQVQTGELSPATFRGYLQHGKLITKFFGRDKLIADLRPKDFESLKAHMAKTKPQKRNGKTVKQAKGNLSLESLRTYIRVTKVFFNFAVDEGLLDRVPWTKSTFGMPTQKAVQKQRAKRLPRQATREEIKAVIAVSNDTWNALILFAINSGSGNMDSALLRWADIKDGWVNSSRNKTSKPKRFKLWPETLKAMEKLKRYDDGLVFHGRQGGDYIPKSKTDQISRIFTELAVKAKVKRQNLSFYSLRHTFQTIADENVDLVATQVIMGHSRNSISDNYRGKISDARLEAVTDHVRRWLFDLDDDK
ncbi:tyrosine-type recombinase/integrase [Mariniblastus sp.]|nr:tyrosine-type recombinase/integrase [Mariniblastus sp.]MDB2525747.1 tyrosine-type recombinase/integrase [Mariniblastus sp.]